MGERTNQLRLSEVKQQLLLDSISDPILALSGNLTVLYCDDFYGKLAGKTTKELVGTNLEVLMPHGGGDWMRDLLSQTLYAGSTQEGGGLSGEPLLPHEGIPHRLGDTNGRPRHDRTQ